MRTADIDTSLVEGYLRMLDNLSLDNKLDLISKLSLSVKADAAKKHRSTFYKAYGAWDSKQSAEQIIGDIRKSRTFKRQINSF